MKRAGAIGTSGETRLSRPPAFLGVRRPVRQGQPQEGEALLQLLGMAGVLSQRNLAGALPLAQPAYLVQVEVVQPLSQALRLIILSNHKPVACELRTHLGSKTSTPDRGHEPPSPKARVTRPTRGTLPLPARKRIAFP
jgi:hypothetical protein